MSLPFTLADLHLVVGGAAVKIYESSSESDEELRRLHQGEADELEDEDAGEEDDEDEFEGEREDDLDASNLFDEEASFFQYSTCSITDQHPIRPYSSLHDIAVETTVSLSFIQGHQTD